MRVDYTLPALQPETLPDWAEPQPLGPSFREQLRGMAVELPQSWQQELRLDSRPFTGTYIGPPPRPATLTVQDAETERARWRSIMRRHSNASAAVGAGSSARSVQNMLDMFLELQQIEDDIVSRNAALTRG